MIPFLTYPLALMALASVPALAAIYILRNRFRRQPVSSLVLWRFHAQSKSGGAKIHRLQLPLIFFLELLGLLLLVVAAAGPHWLLPQSTRPLIVILDDSFSMRAVRDRVSAQARAADFLEKLFRRQPPPSTRFILAGTQPRLLGASVRSWPEAAQLLPQWKCWSPGAAIDSAIALAAEFGRQQANILVLTDHNPADEKISNPRLEWRAFGSPLDNLAIINASRTAFGSQDRCLLEIANYSGEARSAKLLVQAGSNDVQRSILTIGAHGQERLIFNIPAVAPVLRASLDFDALAEDNEVQLLPPIRKRVRVQVALTNAAWNNLASHTLEATGLRAAISDNPELVIRESDTISSSNSWNLRWLSPAGATAYVDPFILDHSHPLAEGLTLEGVVWAAAALTNAPGEVPVMLAGNVPLLTAREDALGRRHLTLNFNPELSTLQNTPDWPILFWNLLQWRIAGSPGLKESNTRLGTEVEFKTTGEPVTVIRPDDTTAVFPKTGGDLALETPVPGLYTVVAGAVTNRFAVNPLAADESDLSRCATGQWGAWGEETERRFEETSAVWMFGLAALAILVTHLYLLAAGKGGR
jgi:hypothetical protein